MSPITTEFDYVLDILLTILAAFDKSIYLPRRVIQAVYCDFTSIPPEVYFILRQFYWDSRPIWPILFCGCMARYYSATYSCN